MNDFEVQMQTMEMNLRWIHREICLTRMDFLTGNAISRRFSQHRAKELLGRLLSAKREWARFMEEFS